MSTYTPSNYDALGTLLVVAVRVYNAAHKGDAIAPDLLKALQDAIDAGRESLVWRDKQRFSYGAGGRYPSNPYVTGGEA